MQAVLLTGHGGPENLVWRDDVPKPQVGPGDVLIQVGAAGVNNTDINTRIGWYSKGNKDAADAAWGGNAMTFPRIQGIDVCGTIVETGPGVDDTRRGERVLVEPCLWHAEGKRLASPWFLGSECDGGFADFVRVSSHHAHAIDSPLSDVELASFPCSYSTAENMLTRASVTADDHVLVTGASGGVGSAAVQLAKARGAYVSAVTSPDKARALKAVGADAVVHRVPAGHPLLPPSSVDVVVDLVAGPTWPALLDALRPGGRYTVAGAVAGPLVELDVRTLYLKDLRFFGCTVLEPDVFANLIKTIERGAIRPLVSSVFTMAHIHTAQDQFLRKTHIGKLVLTPR